MPSWGSYSYAFGPLVALLVLGLLVLILRWAFSRGHSVVAAPSRPGTPVDYGLLVPVAEPETAEQAQHIETILQAAGISCSVAHTTDGTRILVWPDEVDRAKALLRPEQPC